MTLRPPHAVDVARILVSEQIADSGLDQLRADGHEVDVQLDLTPDTLLDAIVGAAALIIRSSTQVTPEVLAVADQLQVVGRAGIGLDNVDVEAATKRGVMVVNAPQSNILSAAEHTMALLLAQARNVPQAHAALVAGRWERSKWNGVELADKTLGIIGLGRIGKLVAERAQAFGMEIIAYDPFVNDDRATQLRIEMVDLDTLIAQSDFLTLHVAKTPETIGLVNAELLAKAKPNLRVINVARGGIVNEADLAAAINAGQVAGAAIDVFDTEPCTDSPLFGISSVVVTPHLGASTVEAQDKAGVTIAEQVGLALAGDFVPFAVNVDASAVSETVRPYLALAEELGALFALVSDEMPATIDIEFRGEIGGYDTKLAVLSMVKGLLGQISDEPVSYVNALDVAADRGLEIRSIATSTSKDYVNVVSIRGGNRSLSGTLTGMSNEHRLVEVDDHSVDVRPSRHMLLVRNDDTPGMIGVVGDALGRAGINVSAMHLGQTAEGVAALMVIAVDRPVPAEVLNALLEQPNIESVRAISRQ